MFAIHGSAQSPIGIRETRHRPPPKGAGDGVFRGFHQFSFEHSPNTRNHAVIRGFMQSSLATPRFSEGGYDDAEQHKCEEGPEGAECGALQEQPCGEGQSGGECAADERAGEQ